MNQPISSVKLTLYDGLNKQPILLGKISPNVFCPIFTQPLG